MAYTEVNPPPNKDKKSWWNHRIMRMRKDIPECFDEIYPEGCYMYEIHEVYYKWFRGKVIIDGYTKDCIKLDDEDLDNLKHVYDHVSEAFDSPILEGDELEKEYDRRQKRKEIDKLNRRNRKKCQKIK